MSVTSLVRYLQAQLAASQDAARALRLGFRSVASSVDRVAATVWFDLHLDQRILAGILEDLGTRGAGSLWIRTVSRFSGIARLVGSAAASLGRRETTVRKLVISALERRIALWRTLESLAPAYPMLRDLDFMGLQAGARRQLTAMTEFTYVNVDTNRRAPISATSDIG